VSIDLTQLAPRLAGKFVVFDGPDGSGKSSQHRRLTEALVAGGGGVVSCRDPGGTDIGERIRSVLLDHDLSRMAVNCETLLFMASRAQLVFEVIEPALREGKTVLCDRFVTATCAYQGAAGYDPQRVIEVARYAIGNTWPDLSIILDVDIEAGFERIGRKKHHAGKHRKKYAGQTSLFAGGDSVPDAMEARSLAYHRKVRELFRELPAYYPRPVVIIDSGQPEETVFAHVVECLARVFG